MIGLTTFGASGRPDELMAHFGITPEAVAASVLAGLDRA
jgi:transketolase